jgi:hypothetical protein
MLNLGGDTAAPTAAKGEISLAIWQLMFPSSTQADGSYFPVGPAAAALELQAYSAVTSGQWTAADNPLYPTFVPDDTTAQRFEILFANTTPVQTLAGTGSQGSAPEPGTTTMLAGGLALLVMGSLRRGRRVPQP